MNRKERRAGKMQKEASDARDRPPALDPAEAFNAAPAFNAAQAFNAAMAHFHAGRLEDADAMLKSLAERYPEKAAPWHVRGLVRLRKGEHSAALDFLERAVRCDPELAQAHSDLGAALQLEGRLEEAAASYKRAVALDPALAQAHCNLGITLHALGERKAAIDCYRCALAGNPDYVKALVNLGAALEEDGESDEAMGYLRQAIALEPTHAGAHFNLGNSLLQKNRADEALEAYHQAMELWPDHIEAGMNLGNLLLQRGRLEQASAVYRRIVERAPEHGEAYSGLGIALRELGRVDEAAEAFETAARLLPETAEAWTNLGLIRWNQGRLEEAVASLEGALALRSDFVGAYNNLSLIQADRGRLAEAIQLLDRGLEFQPDFSTARSNRLFLLNYDDAATGEATLAAHRLWEKHHALPSGWRHIAHVNDSDPNRRLRIGYVSPDFRKHSVSYFAAPLIDALDRSQIEVTCYANVSRPDATTERLQRAADRWRPIVGIPDRQVAELIRRDGIDILVDLAGHTNLNRLDVFALKPAPVQVSWLGYPNTTGLTSIDYRITDSIADPEGEADRLHVERLIRLPHGFLCYEAPADAGEVGPPPSRAAGFVTFASFNSIAKMSARVVAMWTQLLAAAPAARLLLKAKPLRDPTVQDYYRAQFAAAGADTSRIEFAPWIANSVDHLAQYRRVDVALDPFPYNGTTTTCEALWMGVPVVTLRGARHSGRVGASLLTWAGLEDLIAETPQRYIEIAAALAQNLDRRATLRATLRERVKSSPLCDAARFARDMEGAYRDMWRRWCKRPADRDV
jgi:predicted O-linked N-acetylglucosamine transferase (SPINDLY family)